MVRLDLFWRSNLKYLIFDEGGKKYHLDPNAPEEYQKSYQNYLKQKEHYRKLEYDENGNRVKCII